MTRLQKERTYIREIADVIEFLAAQLKIITASIPKPRLKGDIGHEHFLFDNANERTFQVLMLVRIVSGLRATLILVWHNHVIEAGCLIRCIDEYIGNMVFVQDAFITGKQTAEHERLISDYFVETYPTVTERLRNPAGGGHLLRKQKMRAAEGRVLSASDPHSVVELVRAIDSAFDGFVHGSYSSVMNLYVGGGSREGFRVTGMPERLAEYRVALAQYVHRTLNMMGIVSLNVGLDSIAHNIRQRRIAFETAAAYMRPSSDAADASSLNMEDTPDAEM